MKPLFSIFSALALIAPANLALAYDDPAIAVCEYHLKNWALPKSGVMPKTIDYKRTDAKISGDAVTIFYTTAALGTAPRPDSHNCKFELVKNKFRLSNDKHQQAPQCKKFTDDAKMKAMLVKFTDMPEPSKRLKAIEAFQAEMKTCQKILNRNLAKFIKYGTTISLPLAQLRIYPIKPDETDLAIKQ